MTKKLISDIIVSVLSDAISAITILEVKSETTIEGNSALYIKTDDLETVDKDLLDKLISKHTSDDYLVKYLIPETKFINEAHKKNVDTVCIFIEEVS